MSSRKSTARARPATSAPPNSPRTEETQGYRRGRAIRSCLECRRRKMRCNRSRPCQNCNRFCRECVYLPFPEWPPGASINTNGEPNSQSPPQGDGRAIPSFDSNQYTGRAQTSPFTHNDHGWQDELYDNDADDQHLDMVLQIGRLSITEKLNGFFRPHVAGQVSISPSPEATPPSLMRRIPRENPWLSVNMSLCRLRHFSPRRIIAGPRTTSKLRISYLHLSIQPNQRLCLPLFKPNDFYPSNLHLAFWQQFRSLFSLSPGLSSQLTRSSVCFTTNTGPL